MATAIRRSSSSTGASRCRVAGRMPEAFGPESAVEPPDAMDRPSWSSASEEYGPVEDETDFIEDPQWTIEQVSASAGPEVYDEFVEPILDAPAAEPPLEAAP